MRVEIDLYSGRPNPWWDLSEAETREFKDRLASLPAVAVADLPDRLGYRGLRATSIMGAGESRSSSNDQIDLVEVGAGVVKVRRHSGKTGYLSDPGRSLECWLLALAKDRVDEPARQVALAGTGTPCP